MPQNSAAANHELEIILPYQACCSGAAIAAVIVRPLSGEDELAIDEALAASRTAVDIASMLIGLCVSSDNRPIGVEVADALAMGDREILLRAIYAATVSPIIKTQIACSAGCGETNEFSIDIRELVLPPPEPGPVHHLQLDSASVMCTVPKGENLRRALSSGNDFGDRIAQICSNGEVKAITGLAEALARLDPNAECAITVSCAGCAADMEVCLDGFELIRAVVHEHGGILVQIDRIASAYGWSEADILMLPRSRRLRYFEMSAPAVAA